MKQGEGQGDEEVQILEDIACLVFLDDQLEDLEKVRNEDKIGSVLKKDLGAK